jgi:1-acyl-sn-glycerol-3-phosphate acyltransferase
VTAVTAVATALGVLGLALAAVLYRAAGRASGASWGRTWLDRLDGLNRLFCRHYHRLPLVSLPLPLAGPALVVSNHVSGLDPLLLLASSPRPLRFLIAREEYERPLLRWLFRSIGCIPVDRGTRPEQALRAALRALLAGEVVALFPHGRIHLDHHPPRPLKPGVVWLARQARCPVLPVRVDGVRGQGHVLAAVALRGRARLEVLAALSCEEDDASGCLARIAEAIEGRAGRRQGVE